MRTTSQEALISIGRVLLGVLFLSSGLQKLAAYGGTLAQITAAGVPYPAIATPIAITTEILGAALVIFGFWTRIGAWALIGFTLVATYYFHAFWLFQGEARMMQTIQFSKNIAIIGGLLILAGCGAGRFSIDNRRRRI